MNKIILLEFVEELVRQMGEAALSASRVIVEEKGQGGNFATKGDLVCEKIAIELIAREYPKHKVLSEETLADIVAPEKEPCLWIIDPIDGTTNYQHGVPLFAVAVAYVEYGQVMCGAIFDPSRDELFSAMVGQGAFLNGKKISVSAKADLFGALINTGCPYLPENFDKVNPMNKVFHSKGARVINISSAVLETAWVACGRFNAYYEYSQKPWDVAAGSIIVKEAGGTMICL